MFNRGNFRLLVLCLVFAVVTAEDQCPVNKKNCECNFSSDAEDGGESTAADAANKSEMLAAAAGAMSPLLIGGAGMGIWKLLKRGGDDSMGLNRQSSNLSDTSVPPKYSSRSGSVVSVSEEDTDRDSNAFVNTRGNRSWGSDPPSGQQPKSAATQQDDLNSWMF